MIWLANIATVFWRWMRHVARMGALRNAFTILAEKCQGKRLLERHKRKWQDSTSKGLEEIAFEAFNWMHLTQDREHWRDFVKLRIL
jgi:hypothetical protein